jgi:glyceraldehyde-3-phosphate dehydrogenase (ferredoxin)
MLIRSCAMRSIRYPRLIGCDPDSCEVGPISGAGINAERLRSELVMDRLGFCRFHRTWAEEMIPEIIGSLYDLRDEFFENPRIMASRINSRNASVFWESARNVDCVHSFLRRKSTVEKCTDKELIKWMEMFETDKAEAALSFWYEMHKGIKESLREF